MYTLVFVLESIARRLGGHDCRTDLCFIVDLGHKDYIRAFD